jgi:hypothetical protein
MTQPAMTGEEVLLALDNIQRDLSYVSKMSEVRTAVAALLAERDGLRDMAKEQTERADDNYHSYERIKQKYSNCYAALSNAVQVIEQLVPEPSARGVADVVLFQARTALGTLPPPPKASE